MSRMPSAKHVVFIVFSILPWLFFIQLSLGRTMIEVNECVAANVSLQFSSEEYQFLVAQYEVAAQEIRNRVEHEHILFLFKFTATGAVLAFLLQQYLSIIRSVQASRGKGTVVQSVFSVFLWVAVGISQVIDARLHFNTNMMKGLGCWINSIEEPLYNGMIEGWETFLRDEITQILPSFMVDIDRFLLTYLLYVVALYATILEGRAADIRVAMIGAPSSLLLFSINGLYRSYEHGVLVWPYAVAVLLSVSSLWLLWRETTRS